MDKSARIVRQISTLQICLKLPTTRHHSQYKRIQTVLKGYKSNPLTCVESDKTLPCCGSHPLPLINKKRLGDELQPLFLVVGRGGFEPPYTRVNRFTVCRL